MSLLMVCLYTFIVGVIAERVKERIYWYLFYADVCRKDHYAGPFWFDMIVVFNRDRQQELELKTKCFVDRDTYERFWCWKMLMVQTASPSKLASRSTVGCWIKTGYPA
jgi:hypothetical protein